MANYQEARVKLTNTQLKKIKSAGKSKTGTLLRINKKNSEDEELPHKLFLTTRQATIIRNIFPKNMSTDIKLSKTQISKIVQSGGSFGSWLGNLGKKALASIAIPLGRDKLPVLVSNLTSIVINKFMEKKNKWKKIFQAGLLRILFIYFE